MENELDISDYNFRLSYVISLLCDLTLITNGNENKVINEVITLLENIE